MGLRIRTIGSTYGALPAVSIFSPTVSLWCGVGGRSGSGGGRWCRWGRRRSSWRLPRRPGCRCSSRRRRWPRYRRGLRVPRRRWPWRRLWAEDVIFQPFRNGWQGHFLNFKNLAAVGAHLGALVKRLLGPRRRPSSGWIRSWRSQRGTTVSVLLVESTLDVGPVV